MPDVVLVKAASRACLRRFGNQSTTRTVEMLKSWSKCPTCVYSGVRVCLLSGSWVLQGHIMRAGPQRRWLEGTKGCRTQEANPCLHDISIAYKAVWCTLCRGDCHRRSQPADNACHECAVAAGDLHLCYCDWNHRRRCHKRYHGTSQTLRNKYRHPRHNIHCLSTLSCLKVGCHHHKLAGLRYHLIA